MNTITVKRKQRIADERKKRIKARNRKITAVAIAGTFILSTMNGKAKACSMNYTVKQSDTLYSLSKKYDVTIEKLMEANKLPSEKIIVGQQLLVPSEHPKEYYSYTVQKGDTLFSLAQKYGVNVDELMMQNNKKTDQIVIGEQILVPVEMITKNEEAIYTVLPGDTLWGIAERFGITIGELVKKNRLSREMVLIGQRLSIPGKVDVTVAEVVGAADNFTVEFTNSKSTFVLKVPYGSASDYEKISGQKVKIIHKDGAVISTH